MAKAGQSKGLKLAVSMAVSAILLVIVARMVDWPTVMTELSRARLLPFLWVTLAWLLHFILRALRWKFLLPSGTKQKTKVLFDSILLGSFATFVLPLRAGEFVRPLFLMKHSDYSFSTCFVSVVIERFFDLCMVLFLFGVVTMYIPGLPDWTLNGAYALSTLAAGILLFILTGTFLPKFAISVASIPFKIMPQGLRKVGEKFLNDFIGGAAVLKSPLNLFMIILLTAGIWATCGMVFHLFMDVLSIQAGWTVSLTLTVLVALAVAAPSAPGFLGVFQIACIAGFSLFGISNETATAYSILCHMHQFVIFILYGLYVLFSYGMSFGELRTSAQEGQ